MTIGETTLTHEKPTVDYPLSACFRNIKLGIWN